MAAPTATLNKVRYRIVDVSASNPLLATTTLLQASVDMALAKYDTDRPLEVVEDENGAGSAFFVLVGSGAALASWSDGFSHILRIEYPAITVASGGSPQYLEAGQDFEEGYRDASKTYLRMISVVPQTGEVVRFTYTAPHTHTTLADNVPAGDLEALCDLAAHFACMQLATKMAASSDPLIQADSVNPRDGQLKFKQQAEMWLTAYEDKMGIGSGSPGGASAGVKGASANADWDQTMQGGLPFLTHWGRRR